MAPPDLLTTVVAALALAAPAAPAPGSIEGLSASDAKAAAPVPPFRIADNLYYVGSREIAVYLISGSDGLVLLDGGFEAMAPQVLANVETLGFDPARIRLLINSQAHFDHAGALAAIKARTGAAMAASAEDAALLARGGRGDFAWGDKLPYPPVRADRIVRDGEIVKLGDIRLTARLTPGHSKGCTTWQLRTGDRGKAYDALFLCGTSAPGYRLVGNPLYPRIADDFRRSFATWRALPCDFFLGAHGSYYGIDAKRAALAAGTTRNPFIDPEGCRAHIDRAKQAIERQLREQQATGSR
jgi:metallo-beta-lactamase class B